MRTNKYKPYIRKNFRNIVTFYGISLRITVRVKEQQLRRVTQLWINIIQVHRERERERERERVSARVRPTALRGWGRGTEQA
jgi:hypothetical protein